MVLGEREQDVVPARVIGMKKRILQSYLHFFFPTPVTATSAVSAREI